jgi:dipeptidyl aminopeptidase/acylaminoacyl peptidase
MPSSPYGTWTSPITAAAVAAGGLRLGAVQRDGADIYWIEGRPAEGGRYALMRRGGDGVITEVTPPEINVRTRVHEYGGGAYLVRGGSSYCVNFSDQRIYRIAGAQPPVPITAAGPFMYADFELDARRNRLICVREDQSGKGEPVNTLVAVSLGPAEAGHYDRTEAGPHAGVVIASGYDFYSTPRLSPDGSRLAWLSWRHPNMPWDGTELWVADIDAMGALSNQRLVAGGDTESIYQPGWGANGSLYYVSDRTGWWAIYRTSGASGASGAEGGEGATEHLAISNAPADAEFGRPQWVFGTATWAFAGPSRLVVSYTRLGRWYLGVVDVATSQLSPLGQALQPHDWLAASDTHVALVAGFDASPDALVDVEIASGRIDVIRLASSVAIDPGDISVAEPIEFATDEGRMAHAFYYAPRNRDVSAPVGDAPPLIAISHGGPTSAANPTFDPAIQFWTSRGFAVVDVNYGGSTGYGRAYRERLNGRWGIVDVRDVINSARFLCRSGRADEQRLIIRGGSAGGYTTLAALAFHTDVFKAGASYYGISDLEVLEIDTHKFESRYSHSLIGPYPAAKEVYRARSPIHAVDRLACPLILLQGLDDKVVPPNQSEMMAGALRAKGLPVAYLAFEGEQHGFRKAATIIRSLEAELYFYGAVFGFEPADDIEPVHIDNL